MDPDGVGKATTGPFEPPLAGGADSAGGRQRIVRLGSRGRAVISQSASPRRSGVQAGNLADLGLGYDVSNHAAGVLVSLSGELDLATAPELARELLDLIARPVGELTLDLADLTFLDSSGLGALYRTRQAADEQGIPMRLQAVPDHVMRVLDVTAMVQLFEFDASPS